MNRLLPITVFGLSVLGGARLTAAEMKPAAPSPIAAVAEKSPLAGQFTGKWKSSSERSGELRVKLTQDAAATWSAEASFSYDQKQVPMKMKTVRVDGAKVEMAFDWDVDGTAAQSKLSGELTGDTLKGTYETSGAAGNTSGTWSVTRS
jgi:uncharacterized protein involved in outer membrane biogenesis